MLALTATLIPMPVYALKPLGPAKWGNPDQPFGKRRPVTAADKALIAQYRQGKGKLVYSSKFTDKKEFEEQWAAQSDDVSELKSERRPENVSFASKCLKLRTTVIENSHKKWATASVWSNFKKGFGFYEASMKITDVTGINNAFWLVTDDHFEIDICEVHYPGKVRTTLHDNQKEWQHRLHSVGFENQFADNFSQSFHHFGVLWTPEQIIFEVDGEPITAILTHGSIQGPAQIRFSTAVMDYAGKIPVHAENHDMEVNSLVVREL